MGVGRWFLGLDSRFSLLVFLLVTRSAFAIEIPPSIKAFLEAKGRYDLISRFDAIPAVTPEEFAAAFVNAGTQRPLGAGYNGIAYIDNQERVTKFSFAVLASQGKVTLSDAMRRFSDEEVAAMGPRWRALNNSPDFVETNVPSLRGGRDEPLGSQPLGEELLGTLVWAAYNPKPTAFPSLYSADGLAFRGQLVRGVTLSQILASQRTGTALHKSYNMQAIWRQVIFWQQVGLVMLQDSGVTVDLFQPANMIVGGTANADGFINEPTIEIIDHAIARPSPEGYAYYQRLGWKIPEPSFADAIKLIVWPTMPQHIVFNLLWDLNFEQALDFVMAFYDLSDRESAILALSKIEPWIIVEAPFLANYKNIEQARQLVNASIQEESPQKAKRPGFLRKLLKCISNLGG
jgi:hypothetical protein